MRHTSPCAGALPTIWRACEPGTPVLAARQRSAEHDRRARRAGMSIARSGAMQGSLVGLTDVRHQPAWKHWQELTADAPPFLGPEFFTLAAPLSRGSDPFVASAWDGDAMIGALPLVRDHHRLR